LRLREFFVSGFVGFMAIADLADMLPPPVAKNRKPYNKRAS
jgi:hypothetical protein